MLEYTTDNCKVEDTDKTYIFLSCSTEGCYYDFAVDKNFVNNIMAIRQQCPNCGVYHNIA